MGCSRLARFALLVPASALPAGLEASGGAGPVEVGTARGVEGQQVRGSLPVGEAADGSPIAEPVALRLYS